MQPSYSILYFVHLAVIIWFVALEREELQNSAYHRLSLLEGGYLGGAVLHFPLSNVVQAEDHILGLQSEAVELLRHLRYTWSERVR